MSLDYKHNLDLLLNQVKTVRIKQKDYFKARRSGVDSRSQLEESKTEEANLDKLVKEIERKINMTQTELF